MSEALLWRCSCGMPLGVVDDGRLRFYFPGVVDRWGKVAVGCPVCRRERVWQPEAMSEKR